jgi:hypothetical protein
MIVRLLPEEHERIRNAAKDQGMSISELVIGLMRTSAPDLKIGEDFAGCATSARGSRGQLAS